MSEYFPEVSVIATFYNVIDYARRCVESLLAQSVRDRCEFILVDDGSTDGTTTLLEEYSCERGVRVVHQANSGVSAARNSGVSVARGRYVSFVDGDDFVSPCYIEALLWAVEGREDRMASVDLITVSSCSLDDARFDGLSKAEVVPPSRALERVCYRDGIGESVHCKLLPRRVALDNPFPPRRKYEDLAVIGKYLQGVEEVAIVRSRLYAYVMRPSSITNSKTYSPKDVEDYEFALTQLEGAVVPHLPGMAKAWRYKRLLTCARMRPVVQSALRCDREGAARDAAVRNARYLRRNAVITLFDREAPWSSRVRFVLLAYVPHLYDGIFNAWKRRNA